MDAGADRDDLVLVAREAAREAAFAVLHRVDEGHDPEPPAESPGWCLVEVDKDGRQSGRSVSGLHEDFQPMDPSGREGSDLWR
ncbi:hypothetical protein ACFQO7_26375 [Catellatospora aurea]|uniref:Uncharacterized protein n=1 Tax=Catellatospora aurea TaxID=1337874 RepID=A0ABW2H611_9ACTN